MKYFIILCLISLTLQLTYFGEYFQCSLMDECKNEYYACMGDSECSYEMFASPCIDPCGVDYQKFFQQMRNMSKVFNDSQNIAPFPVASCNFSTCQQTWITKKNNSALTALKQCEINNCLQAYPSYTFIAHEYAQLINCNNQLAACEQSTVCKAATDKLTQCQAGKGLNVNPQTNPNAYFHEHVSSFDNPIIQCLEVPQTVQDPAYEALYNCIKPIWIK